MKYIALPQRPKLQHLRAWRQYRLMSQFDLHIKTGVAINTISHIEQLHQTPAWSTITVLAHGLDITKEQLVYEAPPPPREEWAEVKTFHNGGRKKNTYDGRKENENR